MHFTSIAERLLTTLWVGALWSVGYLVLPILFATLDDRVMAGMLAGKMLMTVNYLGLVCGSTLLISSLYANRWRPDWRVILLAVMLLLVAILTFWIQPMMAEIKAQGMVFGSLQHQQFGRLHGISSAIYLVISLCGLGLVVFSAYQKSGLNKKTVEASD